jgi:hypothetical protein
MRIPQRISPYILLPSQLSDQKIPMWVGYGDNDDENVQQLLMIDLSLSFKENTEDDLIYDFLTNPYSPANHIIQILEEQCSISTINS